MFQGKPVLLGNAGHEFINSSEIRAMHRHFVLPASRTAIDREAALIIGSSHCASREEFVKRVAQIILGTTSLIGAMLVSAPAAHAATYGCSGSLVATYPVTTSSNVTFGDIYLYYDSSTGNNCAVNVSTGTGGYGSAKYMDIDLILCGQTAPSSTCTNIGSQGDSGYYSYYAGPVTVYAPHNCIFVSGSETWQGIYAGGLSTPAASNC